ncbi:MAG: hypothetical protein ACLSAW_17930 [Bacteroides stercoris]
MATKSNSRTSVNQLILAGREEAKNVQEIKSVATPPAEEKDPETNVIEKPATQEEPGTTEQETPKTSAKKGLAMLLTKREVKDSEAVKIPRELHRELKMLASMSGITMMQMLGNLIEDFFNENQKEITSYKRKYLNGK